ncbi:hypothetical protein ZIOFF_038851 [Zingiber officinale]|uniref:MYB-CC type transcription factor LHEQLE-containing domain-containing protein n=1 Tax=Zingiber officinale TaxID=94328 RepID=A0A8J5G286_ZINOF|nr:hypothetical protein ZIOFF_038851 [Zingiber officinale]
MFSGLIHRPEASIPPEEAHGPSLVLTADPKPRLRWTADLHERFVDAVAQLGGPESYLPTKSKYEKLTLVTDVLLSDIENNLDQMSIGAMLCAPFSHIYMHEATPKAIMRTMGVKGLTLFHLKSHLQKYRLGKQSGKEPTEQSKDGAICKTSLVASYLLENPSSGTLSPRMPTPDVNEGQEVKEALRAQMEVQRRLFEQVEVQKHVQIRMDAYQKYIDSLLARAYKIASEQVASNSFPATEHDLLDLPSRAVCSPSDILSPAVLHQLSMNPVSVPSPSCKTLPASTTAGQKHSDAGALLYASRAGMKLVFKVSLSADWAALVLSPGDEIYHRLPSAVRERSFDLSDWWKPGESLSGQFRLPVGICCLRSFHSNLLEPGVGGAIDYALSSNSGECLLQKELFPIRNNSLAYNDQLEISDKVMVSNDGGNSNNNPNLASRQRLRWTNELHNCFIDAVTQLGGPDRHLITIIICQNFRGLMKILLPRLLLLEMFNSYEVLFNFQLLVHLAKFSLPTTGATPKGVLRIMGVPGLTIYHVKSHLQKYRLANCIPDPSTDGVKYEIKDSGDLTSGVEIHNRTIRGVSSFLFSCLSGMQITEALKLQMEVQKRLHEQLEVQKQLQLRIEAQGKYLKKIIEEQQRLNGALAETPRAGRSTSAGSFSYDCSDVDKTDSSIPAPNSDPPTQDRDANDDHGGTGEVLKSHSIANSFSSKTLSTDSTACVSSPSKSSKHGRPIKRQRCSMSSGLAETELVSHHILESSSGSDFQQQCSLFTPNGSNFDASTTSICNNALGSGSGGDI